MTVGKESLRASSRPVEPRSGKIEGQQSVDLRSQAAPPRSARSRPAGRRELIERAFDGWSGDAAGKAAEGAKAVATSVGRGAP